MSESDACPYHSLLRRILSENEETARGATEARPDRTGVGTLSVFGGMLMFDLRDSTIPFVTTKTLYYKSVILELLSFLRGETDATKVGSKIWDGNTTREFLDARGLTHYRVGDMGPMYGHSFRNFGARYKGCDRADLDGFDQIENLIQQIRTDPYSRRHVITTFDPSVVNRCVLMPCHGIAIQFYVRDAELSCSVYCRSSDAFLGLPFNIASYAVLTYLVATKCELSPGDLIVYLGDAHVYKNHVEAVKEQLSREILPYPKLKVNPEVKVKDWSEITIEDFTVVGYVSHPVIKVPMAV